jgi:hypothetical protein
MSCRSEGTQKSRHQFVADGDTLSSTAMSFSSDSYPQQKHFCDTKDTEAPGMDVMIILKLEK